MAIKFSTTNKATGGIKILVYGESGVGKTYLIKTLKNVVIISSEHRLLTLKKFKIPVILISNHNDLQEAYDFITSDPRAARFTSVAVDSVSDIAETILAYFKENPKDGNTHPQAAYGAMADEVLPMIKKFRDIPDKNVYFIAKAKRVKDDYTGITSWMPSMPGQQLGPALPYLFDFVLPLRIGETSDSKKYRFLQTEEDIQWLAKECSGNLNTIERPHLGKLFAKILGEGTPESETEKEKEKKPKPKAKAKPKEQEPEQEQETQKQEEDDQQKSSGEEEIQTEEVDFETDFVDAEE